MRSTLNSRSAPDGEARDRIRDAAIVAFAEKGFAGANLREIASRAGVSAALIVHHFGSKEGLREACDAYVVETIESEKSHLAGSNAAERMQTMLRDRERYLPFVDYVSRILAEPSPAADALFDAFLAATVHLLAQQDEAGMLRPQSDPDVTAVFITLFALAPALLHRQLGRALSDEPYSAAMLARITRPLLEIYTHGIYANDRLLTALDTAMTPSPSKDTRS